MGDVNVVMVMLKITAALQRLMQVTFVKKRKLVNTQCDIFSVYN